MVDFVKPFANKNITACQSIITDLKNQLANNAVSWEQPLASLVKAIEQNYHYETLLTILKELSPEIIEALFLRLLSSGDFNSSCLKALVDYVNAIPSDARAHQVALINSVLSSPVSFTAHTETQELILKLNTNEQVLLLTQLGNQTHRGLPNTSLTHQKNIDQKFNENFQQLLMLLIIRASKTEQSLQSALSSDPVLANLLMIKLLETTESELKQKNLIISVFKNSKLYDWTKPHFNQIIQSKLITLVTNLPVKELRDLFKSYAHISRQHHHSATNLIPFIDTLYSTTKDLDILTHCLEVADDADHSFIVGFLTYSKTFDRNVKQICLRKIDIKLLVMLCGHIIALDQMSPDPEQHLFSDYLLVLGDQLKNAPHDIELFEQLVSNISFLPKNNKTLAITTITTRLTTPEHKSLWLQALIRNTKNKSSLMPYCFRFIKENPDKFHLIVPIIKHLENEDLLALYLLMIKGKIDKTAFQCFKELFKEIKKRPQLFYILTNAPVINHELLDELITQLDDKSLISLLAYLLTKTNPESEYKTTINQVLLIFCNRLYSEQRPDGEIHQWKNKPFTNKLVDYLLNNPESACLLSMPYSTVYSWATWTDPALALKYRMDAVLNSLELSQERINQIALYWLEYFYTHPEQIHPLFTALNSSESNRNTIGKKNLSEIKQACWKLMKPGVSYKEAPFLSLIYNAKPELFAPALPHLAKKEFLENDPQQGALWLAKTINVIPKEMNEDTLIILLTHSIHDSTLINWKKAPKWLMEHEPEAQLVFAKKLINKACNSNNNPILSQQTHLFITLYPAFSLLLPQLDPTHWYWLLQNAPQEQLIQHASSWLDLILQKHEVHTVNIGKILSLLPQNKDLIFSLLSKQAFANPETFSQIFIHFSLESASSIHIQTLLHFISEHDKTWIDQFFNSTVSQIKTTTLNSTAINVLHSLILNHASKLSSQHNEDKNLVTNFLQQLNTFMHQSDENKQSPELKQLMISFLTTFIKCDFQWNQLIVSEAAFTQTALTWVHNIDLKTLELHPLTNLLIETQSTNFAPQLINDALFQKWLITLLSSPPKKLHNTQFHRLFELLLPQNKVLLAQNILVKSGLSAIHAQSLELLANVLLPLELYKLFENQVNQALMAKGLFFHHQGLKDLSEIQRSKLFDSINSSTDLLEILGVKSSLEDRYNFIKELFQIYGHSTKTLSEKLSQWLINPEALAAFANFTVEKQHQDLLGAVLKEKPYYQDFLNNYLKNPTLDMPLNENSYLYHLARHNLLQTVEKEPSNAQFISQLKPEEVLGVIKKQFYLNQNIQTLSPFFSPFKAGEKSIISFQRAAQWQHRLILIHSGLLEVLRFYQNKNTSPTTRQIIEQTNLYKECLAPLLSKPLPENLGKTLVSSLGPSLEQYSKVVAPIDSEHFKHLQNALNQHTAYLETMNQFSDPQLYNYFNADLADVPLNEVETTVLRNASKLHQEWLVSHGIDSTRHFSNVLNKALSEIQLSQKEEINKWIFQFALFSSLSVQLDETVLKHYVTSIKSSELSILIAAFFEQKHLCQKAYEFLHNIKPIESINEFIKHLLPNESTLLKQLIAVTESLNLTSLKDLIYYALSIKELGLDEEQISALLPSSSISNHQTIEWLHVDLDLMHERIQHVSNRLDQLVYLGFSYHRDNKNEERLPLLIQASLAQMPTNILIKCLNTYEPVFTHADNSLNLFIKTLDKALDKPQAAKEIIPNLNVNIINQVLVAAIKDPNQFSGIIEKLLNSKWSELCLHQLQSELGQLIKQSKAPQPTCISQLSAEQIEKFPKEKLAKILAIQRLLFYSKPMAELSSFTILPNSHESSRERQLFSADASLYMALLNLEKNSNQSMKNSTLWLVDHSYKHVKNYVEFIDASLSEKEVIYPIAQYYWLCWKAFFRDTTGQDIGATLPNGLISWLIKLDQHQLETSPELIQLITHTARHKLLTRTLETVTVITSSQPGVLSRQHITWLCEQSLRIAPTDLTLYPLIINLNSWSWLEHYMNKHGLQNFALLKAALGNKDHLKEINENEKNQLSFLSTLEHNKFPFEKILELIPTVQDPQVRSLLIIYLLTQEEYLASLKGESVLARLTNNETHSPSRLNALIQLLDPKMLTETIIDKLPPETVVSILCSVMHFHQLKVEQVDSLLKQYSKPEVVTYWLHHYSSMPNAHYFLAHLMKLAEATVATEINKMVSVKKNAIINRMIEHLELFKPSLKILNQENEENRLIFTIRLFLNGHQHQAYVNYINLLTEKLLSKNHQFSLEAIQFLITLSEKQEFSHLNNKIAYLINYYLRAKAQSGEIELFYLAGRANTESMTQLVQLHPVIPKSGPATGFFTQLLGITDEVVNDQTPVTRIPENPLIKKFPTNKTHITSFDYFLMHFKGDNAKISAAINDYLGFYAREGCTKLRRKSVHLICNLMLNAELESPIKEAIFTSFLNFPDLYDKRISYTMMVFDAKRTIQHFGLKGGEKNYTQVINLCSSVLKIPAAAEHQDIIKIATTAKSEAEIELAFNEERGFFANLFRRFKRCWISGWTGFFSPNLPTFVAPASTTSDHDLATEVALNTYAPPYKPEPNLTALLKEIKPPFIQEQLVEFTEALTLFSLKANSKNEIEIRQQVHQVFLQVLEDHKINKKSGGWIEANHPLFLTNRFRLLELIMAQGSRTAVDSLLVEIQKDSPQLQQITTELTCLFPEQKDASTIQSDPRPVAKSKGLETTIVTTLDTASDLIQGAWSWTKDGVGALFKPNSKAGGKQSHKLSPDESCIGTPAP
jgi:hypothetical protein